MSEVKVGAELQGKKKKWLFTEVAWVDGWRESQFQMVQSFEFPLGGRRDDDGFVPKLDCDMVVLVYAQGGNLITASREPSMLTVDHRAPLGRGALGRPYERYGRKIDEEERISVFLQIPVSLNIRELGTPAGRLSSMSETGKRSCDFLSLPKEKNFMFNV